MHLILASQSIGRRKLLEQLKIPFQIITSSISEEKIIAGTPLATLKLRAKMKGEDVARKLSSNKAIKLESDKLNSSIASLLDCYILSADSGVILGDELIGKPKDYDDAFRILQKLSGKTHEFVTAVYMIIISNRKSQIANLQLKTQNFKICDTSYVTFRKLTNEDIKRYLSILDYTKFAGGYALYSGQDFITCVKGSLSNVIGLPIEKVLPILSVLKARP